MSRAPKRATLRALLIQMQNDVPRVNAEAAKAAKRKQAHHKLGLNRSHNEENDWMPPQWIVPTMGTSCGSGHPGHLWEEPHSD